MRLGRIFTVGTVVMSGLMFVGCAQESAAPVTVSQPSGRSSVALTAGSAQESSLPLAVSASFHQEFPQAGLTRVVPGTTETGRSYYRITYIANGTPGSISYYLDGTRLPQRALVTPTVPVTPATPRTPASGTSDVGRP